VFLAFDGIALGTIDGGLDWTFDGLKDCIVLGSKLGIRFKEETSEGISDETSLGKVEGL